MNAYKFEEGNCCGGHCAKYYVLRSRGYVLENFFSSHGKEYTRWRNAEPGSKEEKIAERISRRFSMVELLKRLVKEGTLTQDQADKELEKWDREHPDPELEVTEELEALGKPIPVVIPLKETAEKV